MLCWWSYLFTFWHWGCICTLYWQKLVCAATLLKHWRAIITMNEQAVLATYSSVDLGLGCPLSFIVSLTIGIMTEFSYRFDIGAGRYLSEQWHFWVNYGKNKETGLLEFCCSLELWFFLYNKNEMHQLPLCSNLKCVLLEYNSVQVYLEVLCCVIGHRIVAFKVSNFCLYCDLLLRI